LAGVRAAASEVGGGAANSVVGVASPRWRMAGIFVQAVVASGEHHGLKLVYVSPAASEGEPIATAKSLCKLWWTGSFFRD